MSTRTATTKIERAVEAIESLTIAVVVAHGAADADKPGAVKNVADAREEAAAAFREFLSPLLRVHESIEVTLPDQAKAS